MSRYSLSVAIKHDMKMKSFRSMSDAEDYFFSYRDHMREKFENICFNSSAFDADYSVESLKALEKWYFDLWERDAFSEIGTTREVFEKMMSIYFGEVTVRNNMDARWIVEDSPFVASRYELCITKGSMSITMVDWFHDLYQRQPNKRRTFVYREYNKYFNR